MTEQNALPATVLTIQENERGMAAITHLSGLAGYIVPLGGVIVPIVIWWVKSDNRIISAIAKQALLLNVVVFFLMLILIGLAFTIILIPLSIVGGIVLGLAALALPIVGAVKAADGEYYRYPGLGIEP